MRSPGQAAWVSLSSRGRVGDWPPAASFGSMRCEPNTWVRVGSVGARAVKALSGGLQERKGPTPRASF